MDPRPKRPRASQGRAATIAARVSIATRNSLEAAAKASGKSMSDEIETRLVRSFDQEQSSIKDSFGSHETYALFRLGALITQQAEQSTGRKWHADRHTHFLFSHTMKVLLAAVRPDREDPGAFKKYDDSETSELSATRWAQIHLRLEMLNMLMALHIDEEADAAYRRLGMDILPKLRAPDVLPETIDDDEEPEK